jgi:hypothetical protein
MAIKMDTCLLRNGDLMSAPAGKDIVILNLASDNYIALDEIGRRVWELLEQPRRVDAMCRQLSQEFEATPEHIAADLLSFLTELEKEKLVHVVET